MIKLLLLTGLFLSLVLPGSLFAAEITPDPASYSYGSTSELSPYEILSSGSSTSADPESSTSGELAPTGISTRSLYVYSIMMILLGAAWLSKDSYPKIIGSFTAKHQK